MKVVLGLNLHSHDTGAALVLEDGSRFEVVAISQERLDRIKHSTVFPADAIRYCLEAAGCRLSDVNLVASDFLWHPVVDEPSAILGQAPSEAAADFFRQIRELQIPNVFAEHHACHAASAFYATEWPEATALVVDGRGSYYETQSIFSCRGNGITKIATSHRPGIGWMFGTVTDTLLGFERQQEGKTMGLAGWAKSGGVWSDFFQGQPDPCSPCGIIYPQFAQEHQRWSRATLVSLPKRRPSDDPVQPPFAQYAYAAQAELESCVMELARTAARIHPCKRLCYSGGVALNIPANRRILDSGLFEDFFVQPAASDSGIPLGAALFGYYCVLGGTRRWKMQHAFLGREYSADAIAAALAGWREPVTEAGPGIVARILANDYLVAWWRGAAEYGPRALGHRSILCLPRHPQMKAYLNREVKHREMFRPFAPLVPCEHQSEFFDLTVPSPFMLLNATVRADKADGIPAVVHADGTARVQSVHATEQPELHALLKEVGALTGIPVLLNTSLNLAGEPIVETPADAIDLFKRSKLDALALGPHLITKVPLQQMLDRSNPGLQRLELCSIEIRSAPVPEAGGSTPMTSSDAPSRIVVLTSAPDHPLYQSWIPQCPHPVGVVDHYGPDWEVPRDADLLVTHDTYTEPGRSLIRKAVDRGVPTLILADGILEYRNTWEHPQLVPGAIFQPVLGHKIACLGRSQARILESWGNQARCEVVGSPRFDAYAGKRRRERKAQDSLRVLITTALTPYFTEAQHQAVLQSLRDLKAHALNHSRNGIQIEWCWRLTRGLEEEIGVDSRASDFSGIELAGVLQQVDAVISTPSTAMLEAMLLGLPVALLDYTNMPHYVPAAWRITARTHIPQVLAELADPPEAKMLYQDTMLHDALECTTQATPRLLQLIDRMIAIGREQRSARPQLIFPEKLLPAGDVAFAPAEARAQSPRLYSQPQSNVPSGPHAAHADLAQAVSFPRSANRKILFVSHEASRTGAPVSLLNLVRWLGEKTTLPFRILLKKGGPLEPAFRELGETHALEPSGISPGILEDVGLIYSNTCTNGALVEALSKCGAPVVTHVHELDSIIDLFGSENWDWVAGQTDFFLACSKAVAQALERRGVPADRLGVHYETISAAAVRQAASLRSPEEIRADLQIPADAIVIGACGVAEWRKGPDLFVQLAATLRRNGGKSAPLHFLWIGLLPEDERGRILRHDLRTLGLETNVHFIGEQDNPHAALSVSDIFCLPSREDPFPLVMLEAAALGKPLVCFQDSGGASEFCAKGTGLSAPYLDVPAMANCCARLIGDRELRRRLGTTGARVVNEDFDVAVVGGGIVQELEARALLPQVSNRGNGKPRNNPSKTVLLHAQQQPSSRTAHIQTHPSMNTNIAPSARSADSEALVAEAEASFERGDYRRAAQSLGLASQARPDDFELLMYLGNAQYLSKDWPGAAASFSSAARKRPAEVLAHLSRAAALIETGDRLESEGAVRIALSLEPENANGLKLLVRLMLDGRRFKEAIPICERTLKQQPRDTDTWLALGRSRFEVGEPEPARQAFEQALQCDPTNSIAIENIAALGRQKPDSEPAPAASQAQAWLNRFTPFRRPVQPAPARTYQEIKALKIKLIADIGAADSIRDFGGLWGVHGLYLLEGAKALRAQTAEMVDVTPVPEFAAKAGELQAVLPVTVKMTQGDFRDAALFRSLPPMDVSLLYEVLLHQDNAVEVIKNVISRTRRVVCVAQPVLNEELFTLPNGAVNLQFYPEELKDMLRYSGWWEKEPRTNRFTTGYWMWGQTVSYLESVFYGYGWRPEWQQVYAASEFWNYAMIRFVPRSLG